jgi:glycosyltransferase involved in cell wall biosynthesis
MKRSTTFLKWRYVGKTLPERMSEFYSAQDVLLAPSLWPESFGLVAREALSAGLWVLASDRGAIGEDVTPGINSWIIDVATPQALLSILSEIDTNRSKYLRAPPAMPLHTAQDQAEEVLTIYRDVLAQPLPPKEPYRRRTIEKGLPPPAIKCNLRAH